eukprot:359572-Chlamydomonas_euryale.AAC.7
MCVCVCTCCVRCVRCCVCGSNARHGGSGNSFATLSTGSRGTAVDPGLGLANGALCNDCDLAAEDVQWLRPERPVHQQQ